MNPTHYESISVTWAIKTLSIDRVLNKEHLYEKTMQKCAPKANSRPLFDFEKAFKKLTLFFFRTACHRYVTRMSSVCHSYVLVCHPYITRMYSYVIRMSLVCTCMASVCHSYVPVYHSSVVLPWT